MGRGEYWWSSKKANKGYMTVWAWINPNLNKLGDIVVVRPYDSVYPENDYGVYIAQAGGSNFSYDSISKGLSGNKLESTKFYYYNDKKWGGNLWRIKYWLFCC